MVSWFSHFKGAIDSLGVCYYTSWWPFPDHFGPDDYIDFSVASILAFNGMYLHILQKCQILGYLIPLLMVNISDFLCGLLFNGIIIVSGEMAPLIATLPGMSLF